MCVWVGGGGGGGCIFWCFKVYIESLRVCVGGGGISLVFYNLHSFHKHF